MIYYDGYETDGNLRFVKCPRFGNEEYSPDEEYCRICDFQHTMNAKVLQSMINSAITKGFTYTEMLGTRDSESIVESRRCCLMRNS